MRRTHSMAALIIALALACAIAAMIAIELRASAPAHAPRDAAAQALADRIAARTSETSAVDVDFDAAFDEAMVRLRQPWKRLADGATVLDVALVNATPGADLLQTARECERALATAKQPVQCYVYASTDALESKNLTAEYGAAAEAGAAATSASPNDALVALCWAARATSDGIETDMRKHPQLWQAQQCPASWTGTTKSGGPA